MEQLSILHFCFLFNRGATLSGANAPYTKTEFANAIKKANMACPPNCWFHIWSRCNS